jgi:hypothetical protein
VADRSARAIRRRTASRDVLRRGRPMRSASPLRNAPGSPTGTPATASSPIPAALNRSRQRSRPLGRLDRPSRSADGRHRGGVERRMSRLARRTFVEGRCERMPVSPDRDATGARSSISTRIAAAVTFGPESTDQLAVTALPDVRRGPRSHRQCDRLGQVGDPRDRSCRRFGIPVPEVGQCDLVRPRAWSGESGMVRAGAFRPGGAVPAGGSAPRVADSGLVARIGSRSRTSARYRNSDRWEIRTAGRTGSACGTRSDGNGRSAPLASVIVGQEMCP